MMGIYLSQFWRLKAHGQASMVMFWWQVFCLWLCPHVVEGRAQALW